VSSVIVAVPHDDCVPVACDMVKITDANKASMALICMIDYLCDKMRLPLQKT